MALNPPVNAQGMPNKIDGEYFVLERQDIEIEVKIPNTNWPKKSATGTVNKQFIFIFIIVIFNYMQNGVCKL